METPERLQEQIKSMEGLHNIVATMKALSASNIHQYEQSIESLTDYWHTVELGLRVVMRDELNPRHIVPSLNGGMAAVVFGSDHGMCGRFNEDVTGYMLKHFKTLPSCVKPKVLCLGLRAGDLLERAGQPVDEVLTLPGTANQIASSVQQILMYIDSWREKSGIKNLFLYHNRPKNRASYHPTKFHLLPLQLDQFSNFNIKDWPGRSLPTYTMNRESLLSSLLNQYFFISLFRACAESQSAEHGSRLTAMQAAEKNLDEHIEELGGEYRQARQDIITNELLDIIASFEAMSGNKKKKKKA
ncbi:F0F1 ATP synthase subunit gamma [Cocleimonas sp. KMM 6892]|uniref:F0F1 ATP synthase subunit gamma n=1 Tax=unclassified Cocleimonas TaxID=2639732 RepID=UPI002DBDC999|nr:MULTISPECIES: F0F1 ATP synthase subunit gamma [unclassified Cocleimonas]MEB8434370.1 F0F1 ATP synthase subunit gamma [Cocleimonas sp. KMM 6892]MEC4717227.1 F0F1 ATP synthase subunit gamma [Cocleimonas sp. KMM 6895]MEC4746606.1 F0F1 ATP synthase subunit gamma [Cocleimonas sp. KMM 6896]